MIGLTISTGAACVGVFGFLAVPGAYLALAALVACLARVTLAVLAILSSLFVCALNACLSILGVRLAHAALGVLAAFAACLAGLVVLGVRFALRTCRILARLCLLGLGLGGRLLCGQLGGVHDGELAGDYARAQFAFGVRLHREHGY